MTSTSTLSYCKLAGDANKLTALFLRPSQLRHFNSLDVVGPAGTVLPVALPGAQFTASGATALFHGACLVCFNRMYARSVQHMYMCTAL